MLPRRPAALPANFGEAVAAIAQGRAPASALWPQMSQPELEAQVAPVGTAAVLAVK